MKKTAVVYWSGTGNTKAMAERVAEGARSAGAEVELLEAAQFGPEQAAGFDAIALGCPAMGAEVLEESEFQPMYDAVRGTLGGKTVGLFGSYGWGDGEWMRTWEEDCRTTGCRMPVDPVMANNDPDADALDECAALGAALATA